MPKFNKLIFKIFLVLLSVNYAQFFSAAAPEQAKNIKKYLESIFHFTFTLENKIAIFAPQQAAPIFTQQLTQAQIGIEILLYSFNQTYQSAFVMPVYTIGTTKYVLLGKEAAGKSKGFWSFFGGKKDPGETDFGYSAAREFVEESNIELILPHSGFNTQNLAASFNNLFAAHSDVEHMLIKKHTGLVIVNFDFKDIIDPICRQFKTIRDKQHSYKYREMEYAGFIELNNLKQAILSGQNQVLGYQCIATGRREQIIMQLRSIIPVLLKPYFSLPKEKTKDKILFF